MMECAHELDVQIWQMRVSNGIGKSASGSFVQKALTLSFIVFNHYWVNTTTFYLPAMKEISNLNLEGNRWLLKTDWNENCRTSYGMQVR